MKYPPFVLATAISILLPGMLGIVEQGGSVATNAPASDEGKNRFLSKGETRDLIEYPATQK